MTGGADLTLSVDGGVPVDPSGGVNTEGKRTPILRRPLSRETSSTTTDDLLDTAESFGLEAPEGSVYKSVGDGITRQLTGFNKNEIREGFKKAWAKDKQFGKVIGGLIMSVRCIGFAVGTVINLAARIATLPLALAFGVTTGVLQFIFTPKNTFKKPKEVLEKSFFGGIVGGVAVGSCIGIIGMKISKTMVGIKLDRQDDGTKESLFDRTTGDNAIAGMVGAGAAVGVALVYPAMWQLPFRTGD